MTPLEERVVPDGTQVSLEWLADAAESGTAGTVRFTRTADQTEIDASSLTVTFQANGSATAGADFTLPNASVSAPSAGQNVTVTFAPGQSVYDLSVQVTDDAEAEGWESVTAQLQDGTGYTVAMVAAVTVWIEDNELWVEADSDPVLTGREAWFWLPENLLESATVEWDTNYDGVTFQPDPEASDYWLATTFTTAGNRTIAARVTGPNSAVQIVTLDITIENSPPELTVPDDMTVTVDTPVDLEASALAESGIASVQWSFSYFSDDYEWYFETDPSLTTLTPTYTFPWAGDYFVQVLVTDNNGKSTEGWFHVTVENVAPTATVSVNGPINEGSAATFTVDDIDPDTLDFVEIYADWTGSGAFDLVTPDDYWVNPDGSVGFAHTYTWAKPEGGPYTATIRVEDLWGEWTDYTAQVDVRPVAPQAALFAGEVLSGTLFDGALLHLLAPGEKLEFQGVTTPAGHESRLRYHWKINDQEVVTTTPSYVLPDYTEGLVYRVEAWVSDESSGLESTHRVATVLPGDYYLTLGDRWGEVGSDSFYGTVAVNGETPPPVSPFFVRTALSRAESVDTPFTVQVQLNPVTLAMYASWGATIRYKFVVKVYDVTPSSFGPTTPTLLSTQEYTNTTGAIEVGGQPMDRSVNVFASMEVYWDNILTDWSRGDFGFVSSATPKSPTTWQEVVDALAGLRGLAQQFGDKATALLDAVGSNPGQVYNTFISGLTGAIEQFTAELPGTLQGKLFEWLFGPAGLPEAFRDLDLGTLTDADKLLSLGLQYAGLTWDHVYQVMLQQLGAGNMAAVEAVYNWLGGNNPLDPAQPGSMAALAQRLVGGDVGLDLNALTTQFRQAVEKKVVEALGRAGVQLAAKFVPGAGAISSLVNGLSWLLGNSQTLSTVVGKFLEGADALIGGDPTGLKNKLVEGLRLAVGPMLNLAASQLGLGNFRQEMQKALQFIPNEVDKALRAAVAKVAGAATAAIGGGTKGGLFDGKLAPEKVFSYQGQTYALWAAQEGNAVKIKVAVQEGGSYKLVGVLTAQSFATPESAGHLTVLANAAKALHQATKPPPAPQKPTKNTLPNLKALQDAVAAAEEVVKQDILADACKALNAGCFAAGTKLLTRSGWKAVEEIAEGEEVASRSELDPQGEVAWKPVEACFRRTGQILHLHFPDGEVIRTTPEHPFFVEGQGWAPAGSLVAGDKIATLSGEWVPVSEVFDTQQWEPVYNIRVADYHTYFVGDDGWGFSAWVHNDYEAYKKQIEIATKGNLRGVPPTTLRKWYDQYVGGTMSQAALISQLDRSLGIRGRDKVSKIINAATADSTGKSFAQRIQTAADAAVAAQVNALQQLLASIGVTDAQIGYRGSVARGSKSAEKKDGTAGYPVDWDEVDVDLFIVSDQLDSIIASPAGTPKFANTDPTIGQQVAAIESALRNAVNNTPNLMPSGKSMSPSAFRVFTQTAFANRFSPRYFREGDRMIPQLNPARIIDTLGNVTVRSS